MHWVTILLLREGNKLFSLRENNFFGRSRAKLLNHPRDAFKYAPIAFSMVANDQALEAITEGPNGLLESAHPDCIHVSSSTVAPATSHKLMLQHQEKGVQFIAAPVFGRPDSDANNVEPKYTQANINTSPFPVQQFVYPS